MTLIRSLLEGQGSQDPSIRKVEILTLNLPQALFSATSVLETGSGVHLASGQLGMREWTRNGNL